MLVDTSNQDLISYLGKLVPIQIMTTVKFEDEWIIDFRVSPDFTVQAEEKKEEKAEKVARVYL